MSVLSLSYWESDSNDVRTTNISTKWRKTVNMKKLRHCHPTHTGFDMPSWHSKFFAIARRKCHGADVVETVWHRRKLDFGRRAAAPVGIHLRHPEIDCGAAEGQPSYNVVNTSCHSSYDVVCRRTLTDCPCRHKTDFSAFCCRHYSSVPECSRTRHIEKKIFCWGAQPLDPSQWV